MALPTNQPQQSMGSNFTTPVSPTTVPQIPPTTSPINNGQTSQLGQQVASVIGKARQTYPGQDDAILQAFIRDNQKTLPTVVQKVQGLMSNDRAMRNNNPTAMTTDVAASLGLQEGKDYTPGDTFNNATETTARLIGDPVQTTIKAFDDAANKGIPIFQTADGKPRWSYINLTNDQWKNLTPQQKIDTIGHMKSSGEGSKGYSATQILNGLVSDNQAPNPQSTQDTSDENQVVTDPYSLQGLTEKAGGFLHGLVEPETKMIASGARAIQSTPQVLGGVMNAMQGKDFSGNVASANQTMAQPVLGQKTLGGSSIDENLGSAGTAALQELGMKSPDIIGALKEGGVKGLLQQLADTTPGKIVTTAWKHKVTAGIMYELATNPKGSLDTIGKLIDLIKAP